jgi:rod shape-determining protein MreD
MANLYLFILLISATILQTTIVNQFVLLNGTADLVLLFLISWILQSPLKVNWIWGIVAGVLIGAVSFLPYGITIVGYVLIVLIIDFILGRIWQAPILVLFAVVFIGTVLENSLELLYLWVIGSNITFDISLNRIILPSVILNLLLAMPIFALVKEIHLFSFPEEE